MSDRIFPTCLGKYFQCRNAFYLFCLFFQRLLPGFITVLAPPFILPQLLEFTLHLCISSPLFPRTGPTRNLHVFMLATFFKSNFFAGMVHWVRQRVLQMVRFTAEVQQRVEKKQKTITRTNKQQQKTQEKSHWQP